jgi:hypothetical protein
MDSERLRQDGKTNHTRFRNKELRMRCVVLADDGSQLFHVREEMCFIHFKPAAYVKRVFFICGGIYVVILHLRTLEQCFCFA